MDYKGINCPVCEKSFSEDDDIVVCPRCGAPYHRDCYAEKGKCIFPELHKTGESWMKIHGGRSDENEPGDDEEEGMIVCRHCGHKNSKDSIVCSECGDFLFGSVSIHNKDGYDENDDDGDEDPLRSAMNRASQIYVNGVRVFDTSFGDKDDFDGVSGKELADFTAANPLYYLPIFSRIKKLNMSRINFATFFFGGVWYFYRKQYLKAIILTLVIAALLAANIIISSLWSNDLFAAAYSDLGGSNIYSPEWTEYISWASTHCTLKQGLLMFAPNVLKVIYFVIRLICAVRANRGYYKFCVDKIKSIKEKNPDDDKKTIQEKIVKAGGVNGGIAFMVFACECILYAGLTMYLK